MAYFARVAAANLAARGVPANPVNRSGSAGFFEFTNNLLDTASRVGSEYLGFKNQQAQIAALRAAARNDLAPVAGQAGNNPPAAAPGFDPSTLLIVGGLAVAAVAVVAVMK